MPIEATPLEHVPFVAVALNATGEVTLALLEGLVTLTLAKTGEVTPRRASTTTGEIRMWPTLRDLLRVEHADSRNAGMWTAATCYCKPRHFPARDELMSCLTECCTQKVTTFGACSNGTNGARDAQGN